VGFALPSLKEHPQHAVIVLSLFTTVVFQTTDFLVLSADSRGKEFPFRSWASTETSITFFGIVVFPWQIYPPNNNTHPRDGGGLDLINSNRPNPYLLHHPLNSIHQFLRLTTSPLRHI
jgi:hypothetical protein